MSEVIETKLPSAFQIGEARWFQPNIDKIEYTPHGYVTDGSAIACKILAIKFTASKVLYDIELISEEYLAAPIRDVDSYFVLAQEGK